MASFAYDDPIEDDDAAGLTAAPGGVGRLVQFTGALLSLALVAGLAVWGWQLLVRDVTGVPVVRAVEGPMRVQPPDPGGERASHQGLAVNRIAAEGTAGPPADQVVLAPRSVDLAPEDLPTAALRPVPELQALPTTGAGALMLGAAPETADDAAPPPVPSAVAPPASPEDMLAAAIDAAAREALGIEGPLPAVVEGRVPSDVPGVVRSIRPRPRPAVDSAALRQAATSSTATSLTGAGPVDLDPASLLPGTRLVQFGSFDTADEAAARWDVLVLQFEALMDGKRRVIEEAEAGGRAFYRLRAEGFADLADARRFCSAFLAESADCIPVAVR